MRKRLLGPTVLVTCALVAAITPASANDASVGTRGGAIRPLVETDITMQSEAVQIICMRGYALYRIDFTFANPSSESRRVKLGFPFPDFTNTEEGNTGNPPAAFRAWLNGTELAVAQEAGFDTDGETEWPAVWFTHEAEFPPGASMITVSYLGTPDSSVMSLELYDGLGIQPDEPVIAGYYPYLVHTGAGWAGPIEKSVVRYMLSEDFDGTDMERVMEIEAGYEWIEPGRAELMTAYRKPSPNVYEWTYEDYEPTMDHDPRLAFIYRPMWSESFDPWSDTTASSDLVLGDYEYPPYSIRDGRPDTAWAEAVDGPGTGQWVDIPFGETRDVREVQVLPGYQKRVDLFFKYNRPKRIKVEFSNGTALEIDLADEPGLQVFPVSAAGAESARVTILDVYPGTNERDETYFSEITFASAEAPKFGTYEAVTGIQPPAGFSEPEALAPLTESAPAKPAEADRDDAAQDQQDGAGEEAPVRGLAMLAVPVLCGLGVLAAIGVAVAFVLGRRSAARKAGETPQDAPGSSPPDPTTR